MKFRILILISVILLLNLQIASAEENEYGIVEAWFNDKNATLETVEGVKLRIGEPIDIKITVISKISGHVFIALTETGVTKAFDVSSGPSKQDERIDNLNINRSWSKTYAWRLVPNGAWVNGNAPINIYIGFYNIQSKKDKEIKFTIVNPYILDEQYTGAAAPQPTSIASGATAPKAAPFLPALSAIAMLLVVWVWRRS